MEEFFAWLNEPSERSTYQHYIFWVAEVHHRLVSIHPFRDGNGRVCRLLANLLLMREGYPVLAINPGIKQHFSAAVQSYRDGSHAKFLLIILHAILHTANIYTEYFE